MRQAGRALPEYRKLKETYTFVQLVQNPELAVEVTLQPVRRFGFDAAILFSDILVIPEALGQTYHFRETGGVVMDFSVRSAADIARLSVEHVCERLSYVDKALRLLRAELGDQTALLGFSGSPWTLATFMMEGASVPKYSRALALFQEDRKTYFALAEKLTAAITAYLRMQIAAGIDALQIFDSHGGHLPPQDFQEGSGRWIKDIVASLSESVAQTFKSAVSQVSQPAGAAASPSAANSGRPADLEVGDTAGLETCATAAVPPRPARNERGEGWVERAAEVRSDADQSAIPNRQSPIPIIVFSLGTHGNWPDLVATGADVLGVDWQSSLTQVRQVVPETIALQGNLPPTFLSDVTPEVAAAETRRVLDEMRGRPGHIFNLGHGVTPTAKLENIAAVVETVRSHR